MTYRELIERVEQALAHEPTPEEIAAWHRLVNREYTRYAIALWAVKNLGVGFREAHDFADRILRAYP